MSARARKLRATFTSKPPRNGRTFKVGRHTYKVLSKKKKPSGWDVQIQPVRPA